MNAIYEHDWDVDISQARAIQNELRTRLQFRPIPRPIKWIAGADVAYSTTTRQAVAAVFIMDYETLSIAETTIAIAETNFPYITGYLTFREAPVLLQAFHKISIKPDVIMFDGQGIAHPRSMGIASHMGVLLDYPTIGCAKKRLFGEADNPEQEKGSVAYLSYADDVIGAVLRTRTGVKPVFVSPGHKSTVQDAIELVLRCAMRYRLPEPTRQAHLLVTDLRSRLCGLV
ncbi:deoxyribonuclease V [candidate division KSB1 bacterium]|nr:deoxyribonuclease V [candidate division KSB1 bacterium]